MDKIGIDAGGSLIKVAYQENAKMHLKMYSNQELDELVQWLQFLSPNATLYLTGGKAEYLQSIVQNKSVIVEEFQAIIDGTRFLLEKEAVGKFDECVVINIGTGTSVFSMNKEGYKRLFGSGIGGGTFMGLGKTISGETDFAKLVGLASEGDYRQSDLLVRDIYAPNEAPITGDLTASNFGKVHSNEEVGAEDLLASLIKMIGETILLLATQAAVTNQIKHLVFVGSTVQGNKPLINVLKSFQDLLPYEPVFLDSGSHVGAIGAYIHS